MTSRTDIEKPWVINISETFQNIFVNWQICYNCKVPTEGENSACFALLEVKNSSACRLPLPLLQNTRLEPSNDLDFHIF